MSLQKDISIKCTSPFIHPRENSLLEFWFILSSEKIINGNDTVFHCCFSWYHTVNYRSQLLYFLYLGYSATANHLRHYDALLVPLAVDAGLGETGRLGYLMTRDYGPRVRLGAVTTDLPLIPDKPVDMGAL